MSNVFNTFGSVTKSSFGFTMRKYELPTVVHKYSVPTHLPPPPIKDKKSDFLKLPTTEERRAIIAKGEAEVGNVSSLVDKSGILLFDRDLFHSNEDFWFVWLESAINLGYCKGFRYKE